MENERKKIFFFENWNCIDSDRQSHGIVRPPHIPRLSKVNTKSVCVFRLTYTHRTQRTRHARRLSDSPRYVWHIFPPLTTKPSDQQKKLCVHGQNSLLNTISDIKLIIIILFVRNAKCVQADCKHNLLHLFIIIVVYFVCTREMLF